MDQEICLILGQVSLDIIYWKNLQTDICGPVVRLTRGRLTSRPDHFVAKNLENNGKKRQAEAEAKVVE